MFVIAFSSSFLSVHNDLLLAKLQPLSLHLLLHLQISLKFVYPNIDFYCYILLIHTIINIIIVKYHLNSATDIGTSGWLLVLFQLWSLHNEGCTL